jgi:hypothetical protein
VRRLAVVLALAAMVTGCATHVSPPARSPSASASTSRAPGLRVITRIRLPGGNSRFDYASLDSRRGMLFVAHLGASQVVEVNIRTGRVVRIANVGVEPDVLAFDGHADRLYAASESGQVTIFQQDGRQVHIV